MPYWVNQRNLWKSRIFANQFCELETLAKCKAWIIPTKLVEELPGLLSFPYRAYDG